MKYFERVLAGLMFGSAMVLAVQFSGSCCWRGTGPGGWFPETVGFAALGYGLAGVFRIWAIRRLAVTSRAEPPPPERSGVWLTGDRKRFEFFSTRELPRRGVVARQLGIDLRSPKMAVYLGFSVACLIAGASLRWFGPVILGAMLLVGYAQQFVPLVRSYARSVLARGIVTDLPERHPVLFHTRLTNAKLEDGTNLPVVVDEWIVAPILERRGSAVVAVLVDRSAERSLVLGACAPGDPISATPVR